MSTFTYDNFIQTFDVPDGASKWIHTAMIEHQGKLIAFAMDDLRYIYYAVLDQSGPHADPIDARNWSTRAQLLNFPRELAQVGYGVTGQLSLPLIDMTGKETLPGEPVPEEDIDDFLSSTARLTDSVPFQVLSDQRHIYLFRQSIQKLTDENMLFYNKNIQIVSSNQILASLEKGKNVLKAQIRDYDSTILGMVDDFEPASRSDRRLPKIYLNFAGSNVAMRNRRKQKLTPNAKIQIQSASGEFVEVTISAYVETGIFSTTHNHIYLTPDTPPEFFPMENGRIFSDEDVDKLSTAFSLDYTIDLSKTLRAKPLVNASLLVDRFVLVQKGLAQAEEDAEKEIEEDKENSRTPSGKAAAIFYALQANREVRYRRSRNKYRPQSPKDSLGPKDMNGNDFVEATLELRFIQNLHNGSFSVALLPTAIGDVERWQIFAFNAVSNRVDGFNIGRSREGLFDTKGVQLYTSPDPQYQSSVLEREAGKDPFTGLELIPLLRQKNYGGSACVFSKSSYISLENIVSSEQGCTVECWIKPMATIPAFPPGSPLIKMSSDQLCLRLYLGKSTQSTELTLSIEKKPNDISTKTYATHISSNHWSHLTFSYDQISQGFYIYENGSQTASINIGSGHTEWSIQLGPGYHTSLGIQTAFDELRIWSYARQAQDILDDHAIRLIGNESDLAFYSRMDAGIGNAIYNLTQDIQAKIISSISVTGSVSWSQDDPAPIGPHPGIERSSFQLTYGNSVLEAPGLASLLYYQQEDVAVGHGPEKQALKRSARLMLAISGTLASGSLKSGVPLMLDFGVANSGRIAQAPSFFTSNQLKALNPTNGYARMPLVHTDARGLSIHGCQLTDGSKGVHSHDPVTLFETALGNIALYYQDAMKTAKQQLSVIYFHTKTGRAQYGLPVSYELMVAEVERVTVNDAAQKTVTVYLKHAIDFDYGKVQTTFRIGELAFTSAASASKKASDKQLSLTFQGNVIPSPFPNLDHLPIYLMDAASLKEDNFPEKVSLLQARSAGPDFNNCTINTSAISGDPRHFDLTITLPKVNNLQLEERWTRLPMDMDQVSDILNGLSQEPIEIGKVKAVDFFQSDSPSSFETSEQLYPGDRLQVAQSMLSVGPNGELSWDEKATLPIYKGDPVQVMAKVTPEKQIALVSAIDPTGKITISPAYANSTNPLEEVAIKLYYLDWAYEQTVHVYVKEDIKQKTSLQIFPTRSETKAVKVGDILYTLHKDPKNPNKVIKVQFGKMSKSLSVDELIAASLFEQKIDIQLEYVFELNPSDPIISEFTSIFFVNGMTFYHSGSYPQAAASIKVNRLPFPCLLGAGKVPLSDNPEFYLLPKRQEAYTLGKVASHVSGTQAASLSVKPTISGKTLKKGDALSIGVWEYIVNGTVALETGKLTDIPISSIQFAEGKSIPIFKTHYDYRQHAGLFDKDVDTLMEPLERSLYFELQNSQAHAHPKLGKAVPLVTKAPTEGGWKLHSEDLSGTAATSTVMLPTSLKVEQEFTLESWLKFDGIDKKTLTKDAYYLMVTSDDGLIDGKTFQLSIRALSYARLQIKQSKLDMAPIRKGSQIAVFVQGKKRLVSWGQEASQMPTLTVGEISSKGSKVTNFIYPENYRDFPYYIRFSLVAGTPDGERILAGGNSRIQNNNAALPFLGEQKSAGYGRREIISHVELPDPGSETFKPAFHALDGTLDISKNKLNKLLSLFVDAQANAYCLFKVKLAGKSKFCYWVCQYTPTKQWISVAVHAQPLEHLWAYTDPTSKTSTVLSAGTHNTDGIVLFSQKKTGETTFITLPDTIPDMQISGIFGRNETDIHLVGWNRANHGVIQYLKEKAWAVFVQGKTQSKMLCISGNKDTLIIGCEKGQYLHIIGNEANLYDLTTTPGNDKAGDIVQAWCSTDADVFLFRDEQWDWGNLYMEQPQGIKGNKTEEFALCTQIGEQYLQCPIKGWPDSKHWQHIALNYQQAYVVSLAKDYSQKASGDSRSSYLDAGKEEDLNLMTGMSIEMFIHLADIPKSVPRNPRYHFLQTGYEGLIKKGDTRDGMPYQLYLRDGRLYFAFETEGEEGKDPVLHTFQGTGPLYDLLDPASPYTMEDRDKRLRRNLWENSSHRIVHIAVSRKIIYGLKNRLDPASFSQGVIVNFYINGQEVSAFFGGDNTIYKDRDDQEGTACTLFDGLIESNNKPLEMGRMKSSNAGDPVKWGQFGGAIAEVRIWDRVLDQGEINKSLSLREKGLLSYWPMNEGKGFEADDIKGGRLAKIYHAEWNDHPDPYASPLDLFLNGEPVETELSPVATGSDKGATFWLDELRVWEALRTKDQISDNLFAHLEGPQEGLTAVYSFNDTNHAGADSSRRNHHLAGNTNLASPATPSPICLEMPQVAYLEGKATEPTAIVSRPGMAEYADIQFDLEGTFEGVLKRAYSYLESDGTWTLLTGSVVGSLKREWISQVQGNPEVIGFIEGAPPVPSENLTSTHLVHGEVVDYGGASSVELSETDNVQYHFGTTKAEAVDSAASVGVKSGFTHEDKAGFGYAKQLTKVEIKEGVEFSRAKGKKEQWGVSRTFGKNNSKSSKLALGGAWEINKPEMWINRAVGRRFLPSNVGYALVKSDTFDVYAIRLEQTHALLMYMNMPNPDIPKDINIIIFEMNPFYTKQGTLDGKVGLKKDGTVQPDPSYPGAASYGEYSYYKPKEAYRLKKRIERERELLKAYHASYSTSPTLEDNLEDLRNKTFNTSIVNTYVWTAKGGFHAESTENLHGITESTSGSHHLDYKFKVSLSLDLSLFGPSFGLALDASWGTSSEVVKTADSNESEAFHLSVDCKPDGDLQLYVQTDEERAKYAPYINEGGGAYTPEGKPILRPGKVDAYRFMSFFLESEKENLEDFFRKVVDPIWLAQSNDPNAHALRQANKGGKCWRIMHRVTFVSRVLPPFESAPAIAKTAKELNINSNWELISKLEPFVREHTHDYLAFIDAVHKSVKKYLPTMVPYLVEITRFMCDYYGVFND
ncbi:MAG: LamG domain-containing protein [Bacteroidota bacterium]